MKQFLFEKIAKFRSVRERFCYRAVAVLRAVWNATDVQDRLVFPGVALIGVGVYMINVPAAFITVGALLILAVRPLKDFFI